METLQNRMKWVFFSLLRIGDYLDKVRRIQRFLRYRRSVVDRQILKHLVRLVVLQRL